ncbi:hypothetical protein IFM89_006220 [Coptis chinensis]|uniref:Transposase n=1 Tax=Coptis chinensis TaxID=261450 RepID=A0A835HCH7_9MAGN|nr:hypothetical protein IFM89_006220 [Coptis chinensis]
MDNILDCDSEVESPVEPSVAVEPVGSQPPTSTVTSVSISKKRPRSSVWNHFNVKADKNDDGSEVKKPDGGGTSHLRRHAESCVIRTSTEKGQTIIGRTENGVVYSFKFNQIIAHRETVRYFVVEELPFVKVEKPTFHRWIKMAFGLQFKPPCRSTMRSDVMLSFQEERIALKDILRSVPGTITLDNASQLKDKFFGDATLSRELCHLRCTTHVMNLIVKAGLKHVEVSLNNIRESVKHLKSSQGKLEKFFENCKSLNMKTKRLPVDIPTRWNSTFIMLRDAILYQKVIDLFFYGEEYANTPTLADWKNDVAIRDLFKVYQDATKLFSGSRYVTSSAFCYQLSKILLVLKKCDSEPAFKPMYTSMRKKYDRYWKDVPLVLGLPSCMDPRYKFTILELCVDLNYESEPQVVPNSELTFNQLKMKTYKTKLAELFEEYEKKMGNTEFGLNQPIPNSGDDDDIVFDLLLQRRASSSNTNKSDLQHYLEQPVIKVDKEPPFNVLDWWKTQEVPSESAFSTSARVVSKYRSSLLPETIEALMCLKDWFQAEERLQDHGVKSLVIFMLGEPNGSFLQFQCVLLTKFFYYKSVSLSKPSDNFVEAHPVVSQQHQIVADEALVSLLSDLSPIEEQQSSEIKLEGILKME